MVCKKFLRVGLLNAGSLGTNHDDFIVGMDRHAVDIMAINETWIRPGEDGRAPRVPGYRLRHIPRPDFVRGGRGGGVGFFVKVGVVARTRAHPIDPRHKNIEQMWLTTTVNGKKLAIGTAYRPPWLDVELFLDAVTDSINSFSGCDNLILLGDFNINVLNNSDIKTKHLLTTLQCLNLSQIVTTPTHFTDNSNTLIDLVCTDLPVRRVSVESTGSLRGHAFVICEFNIKKQKCAPHTITYRPLKNICPDAFGRDTNMIRWDLIQTVSDVNEMVHLFTHVIISLFDIYAPLKTTTFRKNNYPWITDNVKLMMQLRNEALSTYRQAKSRGKLLYYKSLKTLVNSSMFFEKQAYYKFNINNKINNPKVLWKNLKSTLLPVKNYELPTHLNDVNLINNHFLNIPGQIDVTISLLSFFEFQRFSHHIFSIKTVSSDTIFKIIKGLKSNAEGYDRISLKMLLMTLPHSLDTISAIVNLSITTSIFPDLWKVAVVRPLPKNNNPTDVKDLRPISILPCASKILERVVCQQMTDFLEKNKVLPEVQSGFRKGRSTTTALLDVTDNILAAQDEGMCTLLVLLDFSRAFDSINTTLLLSKLSYYGFDTAALNWFHSYLTSRQQFVELRQPSGSPFSSNLIEINRGVPQGSILGPILFILFSADIISCIKNSKYHIYADDVQVYIHFRPSDLVNTLKDLNDDLKRISAWSADNGLLLNPLKTKFMVLGTKRLLALLPETIQVSLMSQVVDRIYEARNLGLNVDADMRYEKHIADSVQNCFYRLKTLYNLRPYLSEDLRIQLVETLVLSKLNYADIVYGPRLLSRTQRLVQRVQNACARFCFNIPPRSHVTPFLSKHFVLKMKSRRKLHLACLLFGIIKFENPTYLYRKLKLMASSRQCSRRHASQQLCIPRHRTANFTGAFRYAASKCWNNLPPPIRALSGIVSFRFKLKKYLLDEQIQHADVNIDMSFI